MTIPALPIPNVTPGAVQQAPGFAEQVAPGLSALANVLALRQRRAELDQQQQELAFRVEQAKLESQGRIAMGQTLQQVLPPTMTDVTAFGGPTVGLPTGLPGGGTVPMALPKAVTSVLGTTIRNADPEGLARAAPYLQSAVGAEYRRQEDRRAAAQFSSGDVEIRPVGPRQELWFFSKRDNTLRPAVKPDGTIATAPEAQGAQGSFVPLEDDEGKVVFYNPTTRTTVPAPGGMSKAGTITESERRFALLYPTAALAFKNLQKVNFGGLTFADAVLVFSAMRGDRGAIREAGSKGLLTSRNRALVANYAELIGAISYGKSGANVNQLEFASQRNLIPWQDDDPATRQQIIGLLRGNVQSLYGNGYRQLLRNRRRGLTFTPIEEIVDPNTVGGGPSVITDPDELDVLTP